MDLTAKERQGRGLDALAAALRPYVEARMAVTIEGHNWVALYEAKESHRRGRPFTLNLADPRLLMQMIRYERVAFTDIDASQRAWLEELIQAANRAAHTTEISQRQADRALDTVMLLVESLQLDVPALVDLRLADEPVRQSEEPASAPRRAAIGGGADGRDAEPDTEIDADEPAPPQQAETFAVDTPRGTLALTAVVDGARITVLYQEAVNLALTHNNVSPIRSIEIFNPGDHDLQLDALQIVIDPPAAAGDLALGVPLALDAIVVGPDQTYTAQGTELAMRLSASIFLALDEAVTTTVRLTVAADEADYVATGPIRLLTAEEWWAAAVPESLAAFVRPNDPAIQDLLKEASRILGEQTNSSSLEGYQAGPGRVQEIAGAIYDALAARQITYIEPPASFEGTGQRIRTHGQVLKDGLGTCLDLACTYAAALEQAGIHPVLAVCDGHAFTGYLTEEDQLPSIVIRDEPTVITVVDSDFFDAVETTTVCQPGVSFDQARENTTHWWSADLGRLRMLLDVHAAHHRVRPLPTIRLDGNTRIIEVVRDATWQPSNRTPARTEPRTRVEPAAGDTPPRIQRWERALLDMSYANPLLRRKNASTIGIHIPNGSLGIFEDKIADGTSLRLVAHDEIEQIHRAQGARTAADIEPEAIRTILEQESRLFVAVPEREYQRRLKSLARRSKTAVEETGSDNLYLTLGALEWTDGGRKGSAPLFLVPIKLTGGRGVVPFSIELDDSRERVPNYCLIEKLKVSYGLDIPELEIPETDESGIDVAGALGAIRTAILRARNTVGFHVEETAYLALLQFSTLEMWQDLRTNWREFIKRPAVKHLVDNPGGTFQDGIAVPDPQPQDEARTFLPIPADGSQIDAVRWAAAGKTFILEGPPGTGKSQTITNLIANSMAMGKKVLFVAEKSAALDVVRRRLDSVGLGVFSLDVHGRTQTVAAVRDQLRIALDEYAASETGWEPLQSSYATATESLARYPVQLHQPGPVGLSAWDARQLILEQAELGADEATAVEVPRSVVLGDVDLPELYNTPQELSSNLFDLGIPPPESPWRLSGALDPENLDGPRLADAIARLERAERSLDNSDAGRLAARLLERDDFSALAAWFDSADAGSAWPTGVAADVVDARWVDEADRRRAAVASFPTEQDQRLGCFTPAALQLDLDTLLTRSHEIDHRLFGKRKRREALISELTSVLRSQPDPSDLSSAVRNVIAVRDANDQLRGYVGQLPLINPRQAWSAFDERDVRWFEATVAGLRTAAVIRNAFARLASGAEQVKELDASTDAFLRERRPTAGAADALRAYRDAWADILGTLNSNPATIGRWLAGRDRSATVRANLDRWRADAQSTAFIGLQRWARLRRNLDRFSQLGIDDLVRRAMSDTVDPLDLEPQLRIGVAKAVLEERLASGGLAGFDEADHGRRIEYFARRASDVRVRMPNELRSRVIASRSFDPNARMGEVQQLRAELGRRRGGRSVRRLLHDFGSLITEVTPCLLMSPHSVARFLPATADFDIVVFDEASQIRVPESIGAIGRGKAAVIVGDSKQMPPTSMFAAAGEGPDEDQEAEPVLVPADLESILSEAVESELPRKLLSWHYRSKDESLIAFSNMHYYEGRLSSFPAPPTSGGSAAIDLRRVNGSWEGGGARAARVNRAEASGIIEEIRTVVRAGESTIGVVTFNSQQRDLILDLLESDDDPRIAQQLQRDSEPLFVKNLENVQGDERDVILFSLAFSEDERGHVPLNWGPLTRSGGERRLNVAITRAKERVVMFASFDPRRLDLSNSNSQGLRDLKDYLLQAASGGTTAVVSQRTTVDKHLEDVAVSLRASGLDVRQNVGLSDFVVDLAVREPGMETWVAVLLDGPGWAARTSVGDRETLPQAVLTNMGWPAIERVWLPTWLRDRESVIESIKSAVERGHSQPAEEPAEESSGVVPSEVPTLSPVRGIATAGMIESTEAAPRSHEPPVGTSDRSVFRPAGERPVYEPGILDLETPRARAIVAREIDRIIEAEAPILIERLIHVLAARFNLSRVRESRRLQLLGYLQGHSSQRAPNGDIVFWSAEVSPDAFGDFRVPEPGGKRDIAAIPYEELRNAMVDTARAGHGIDEESLLRETARVFGITRLASQVRPRLEGALAAAATEGWLQLDGVMVRVNAVA